VKGRIFSSRTYFSKIATGIEKKSQKQKVSLKYKLVIQDYIFRDLKAFMAPNYDSKTKQVKCADNIQHY
jgi:hypothetical protein